MNSTPTYPLTPLKNGVQHPKPSAWGDSRRWVPTFAGMIGLALSACSEPHSVEKADFRIVESDRQEVAQEETPPTDEILEEVRSENKEKPKVNCHGEIGFQLLDPAVPEVEFPIGSYENDVNEQMSNAGFLSQNFLRAPRAKYVNSDLTCAQRMGFSSVRYCRKEDYSQESRWYVARASFSGVEVSGKCVFGLKKPLEYRYHQTRMDSDKETFAIDPNNKLKVPPSFDWPETLAHLKETGWTIENSEWSIKQRKEVCNRQSNKRVEFLDKRENGILLSLRVHLKDHCEDSKLIETKVTELEPLY